MMIELRDASVIYPTGQAALRDCSLTFIRGQFTLLLGPSGAGKSTLLRCLNLLVQSSRGSVWIEELGPLSNRRSLRLHRRGTGMIFQQHHLIPRHTALQNVLMGRLGYHRLWRSLLPAPRGERRIALECWERVGLLHKALARRQPQRGRAVARRHRSRAGSATAITTWSGTWGNC